jgi:hypothetical protein
VHPSAERSEHPAGVGGVPRLAKKPTVEHHLGVGPQDESDGWGDLGGDGSRLGARQGDHGLGRGSRRHGFRDSARPDAERDAEPAEKLPPAG